VHTWLDRLIICDDSDLLLPLKGTMQQHGCVVGSPTAQVCLDCMVQSAVATSSLLE
jgi:hypothetical protein